MKLSEILTTVLLASALMFTVAGCEEEGPLEKAGEKIDEGVEETGDAIEDATDGD